MLQPDPSTIDLHCRKDGSRDADAEADQGHSRHDCEYDLAYNGKRSEEHLGRQKRGYRPRG